MRFIKISLSVMETQQNEANREEISHSVLVTAGTMGPGPIKFSETRWCRATRLIRELECTQPEVNRPPARTRARRIHLGVIWDFETRTTLLISKRVVGIRVAVLPIVSVGWHPRHPDRNSSDWVHDVSCHVCPS